MSNARTLAGLIDDTNTRIKIPSGYGLDFADYGSEDSNSNTTVGNNLMSDYEEGTWSPAYSFSSGSATIVTQSAKYTKVGNVVVAQCRIYTSSISSPSGNTLLNGLPFTSNSSGVIMSGMISEMGLWATSMPDVKCSVPANMTSIEIQKNATNNSSLTALQGSDFSSGNPKNVLGVTVVYYV